MQPSLPFPSLPTAQWRRPTHFCLHHRPCTPSFCISPFLTTTIHRSGMGSFILCLRFYAWLLSRYCWGEVQRPRPRPRQSPIPGTRELIRINETTRSCQPFRPSSASRSVPALGEGNGGGISQEPVLHLCPKMTGSADGNPISTGG